MFYKEFSGCFLLSPEAIALRLQNDPTWLEGVGALEVYGEDVSKVFPSNELPYAHQYNDSGAMIQRLSYTPKGVLVVANHVVPPNFLRAFAAADPEAIPFVDGHYSKICSPDATGECKVYYSSLSPKDPVCHLIPDDVSFVIQDVDILGLKTGTRIAATVVWPKRSPERQVVLLENSDNLGNPSFKPIWKLAPWSEGYDVRALEGFSNGLNDSVYLFIDRKTNSLMKVVNDGKPEVLEENVKILFRAATGSEIKPNHLTTTLTEDRFIDLRLNPKTLEVDKEIWLRETNSSLEPLFQTVCSMVQPEGVSAPHGMFIHDKGRSQVLIYRHRPTVLNRVES